MPLNSFTPTVRSPAYDLIDQAYNRFVASQTPPQQVATDSGVSRVPDFFAREQPGPVRQGASDNATPRWNLPTIRFNNTTDPPPPPVPAPPPRGRRNGRDYGDDHGDDGDEDGGGGLGRGLSNMASVLNPGTGMSQMGGVNRGRLDPQSQQAAMAFLLQHIAGLNRAR